MRFIENVTVRLMQNECFRVIGADDSPQLDDRQTNPPSPCGSEAALEYCADFSHQPYIKPQFLNSSPKKGTNEAFVATPFIGNFHFNLTLINMKVITHAHGFRVCSKAK